jgi:AcrR family transcriptional regulator
MAGLRERKKERTRLELMAVAAQLFNDRGFDHVTIEDIAAAADVSPRTFYRYFPAKEDLILGSVEERGQALVDAIRARPDGEPILDSIRGIVREYAADFEANIDTQRRRAAVVQATPSLKMRSAQQ